MKLFKDKIKKNYYVIYIMLSIIFLTGYKSFDYEFLKEKKQPDNIKHSKNNPKVQKSFQNLIKGCDELIQLYRLAYFIINSVFRTSILENFLARLFSGLVIVLSY